MKSRRSIIVVELIGFFIVTVSVWINEFYDLPHYLFGMSPERFNYHEALFESFFVMAMAAVVVMITLKLTRRISQLESLLPICSFCKKIREPDTDPFKQESWKPLELYIGERTGSEFTHGLCPECTEKHYGMTLK